MRLQGTVRTLTAMTLMLCLGAAAHAQPTRGRDYNARSIDLGNDRIRTEFHVKWINYLDEDLAWREIDPDFVETAAGFEMTKASFEVREPPLEQTMRALGVADVPGRIERGNLGWGETEYVVYLNAYPEAAADLIYWVHQGRVPRLRKFIRFREPLTRDAAFRFEIAFAEDVVERVHHGRSITGRSRGAAGPRANSLHSFHFWDSREGWNGRRDIRFDMEPRSARVSARGRPADGPQLSVQAKHAELTASTGSRPRGDPRVYILTKHIEADFFRSAALPAFADTDFYPDEYDTPGATSMDGLVSYVGPDGTTWSTVRNAPIGTGASDTGAHFRITTRKCSSANMSRGITDFDTSSLGAAAHIQSATLYLANCSTAAGGGLRPGESRADHRGHRGAHAGEPGNARGE